MVMEYGFHYVKSLLYAPQKFMLKEIHVNSLCCSVELISTPYLELKYASALAALVQSTMFNLVVLAHQSVLLFFVELLLH